MQTSTIEGPGVRIVLPIHIARDVMLYSHIASRLERDGTPLSPELRRALNIRRGIARLADGAPGRAALMPIWKEAKERLVNATADGPPCAPTDDNPVLDEWVIAKWQNGVKAAWNAIMLDLIGAGREDEWRRTYGLFYLGGFESDAAWDGPTHYRLEPEEMDAAVNPRGDD